MAQESYSLSGRCLRHRDHQVWLNFHQSAHPYAADRSFRLD
ncbi:hypothetical protein [Streptomyces sp. NPDC087859]